MITRFFTWLSLVLFRRRHRSNLEGIEKAVAEGGDVVKACRDAGIELDPEIVEILNAQRSNLPVDRQGKPIECSTHDKPDPRFPHKS